MRVDDWGLKGWTEMSAARIEEGGARLRDEG